MAEPWVSIDAVAAHLGVRRDSIYRWIERRGLPATKIGKLWKLKLTEVDAWMLARKRRRAAARSRSVTKTRAKKVKVARKEARRRASVSAGPSDAFAGGGEMGALMRSMDWSKTPLGPVARWPQSLRTTVSTCLSSRFPIVIWWG